MSKLIRYTAPAPAVMIGDDHPDIEREAAAEKRLRQVFPSVAVVTNPDGSRVIPLLAAAGMVEEHRQQLDRTEREAHQTGHQAGLNQGRAEGVAQAEQIMQRFDDAIRDAVQQRHHLLVEAKQKILDLVVAISRKVTCGAVVADPKATLSIISAVIDTLVDPGTLKIKVSPEHHSFIQQNIDRFAGDSALIRELTIESDARVRSGGCLIETPTDDIDARVESQLQVIEETLLLDEESHEPAAV